jgi:uncharacterized membrane protein YcaP (DUF421 family)
MERMFTADWESMFVPDMPILEIVVRGTIIYLAIFVLLRFVLVRQAGSVGITDLLVVVLVADAAQNAMGGSYQSIPNGIVLVGTIIFWAYALDWVGFHFPRLQRWIFPPPLPLIEDGELNYRNMRRELISKDELMTQLRLQGIEDISEVRLAQMEGDGRISVVSYESHQNSGQGSERRPAG